MALQKSWHQQHQDSLTFAQKLADKISGGVGTLTFVIIQIVLILVWIVLNLGALLYHWDPYPYALLGLLFGIQAALTGPFILMAQDRQEQRDRAQAEADYKTAVESKKEIEEMLERVNSLEVEKIDRLIAMVAELKLEIKNSKG